MDDIKEELCTTLNELKKRENDNQKTDEMINALKRLIDNIEIKKNDSEFEMDELKEELRIILNELRKQAETQNLDDLTKEKVEEHCEKTNEMIFRLEKLIKNIEIEKNYRKVKMNELQKKLYLFYELQENVDRKTQKLINGLKRLTDNVDIKKNDDEVKMDRLKDNTHMIIHKLKTRRLT